MSWSLPHGFQGGPIKHQRPTIWFWFPHLPLITSKQGEDESWDYKAYQRCNSKTPI